MEIIVVVRRRVSGFLRMFVDKLEGIKELFLVDMKKDFIMNRFLFYCVGDGVELLTLGGVCCFFLVG